MALIDIYQQHTNDLQTALQAAAKWHAQINEVTLVVRAAFAAGNKVLVAGNGGSATLAEHLSDEMVGRYKSNRPPYPVIALTADSAVLTCIGNDFGFENIFKRQVEALGKQGDVFIGFSTSGNSANILLAAEQALAQGLTIVAFTGQTGKLKDIADYAIVSPATTTNRIQEMDLHAVHLLCEAFEPENITAL